MKRSAQEAKIELEELDRLLPLFEDFFQAIDTSLQLFYVKSNLLLEDAQQKLQETVLNTEQVGKSKPKRLIVTS